MGMSLFVGSCCTHGCYLPAMGAAGTQGAASPPPPPALLGSVQLHPKTGVQGVTPGPTPPRCRQSLFPTRLPQGTSSPCPPPGSHTGWAAAQCLAGSERVHEMSLGGLSPSREERGGLNWASPHPEHLGRGCGKTRPHSSSLLTPGSAAGWCPPKSRPRPPAPPRSTKPSASNRSGSPQGWAPPSPPWPTWPP